LQPLKLPHNTCVVFANIVIFSKSQTRINTVRHIYCIKYTVSRLLSRNWTRFHPNFTIRIHSLTFSSIQFPANKFRSPDSCPRVWPSRPSNRIAGVHSFVDKSVNLHPISHYISFLSIFIHSHVLLTIFIYTQFFQFLSINLLCNRVHVSKSCVFLQQGFLLPRVISDLFFFFLQHGFLLELRIYTRICEKRMMDEKSHFHRRRNIMSMFPILSVRVSAG